MKFFEIITHLEEGFERLEKRERMMVLVIPYLLMGALFFGYLSPTLTHYTSRHHTQLQALLTQYATLYTSYTQEASPHSSHLLDRYLSLKTQQEKLSQMREHQFLPYRTLHDPASFLLKTANDAHLRTVSFSEKKAPFLHALLTYHTWEVTLEGDYRDIVLFLQTLLASHPRFIINELSLEKKEETITLVSTLSFVGCDENL